MRTPTLSTTPLLEIHELGKNFGGLKAVVDLSFHVDAGTIKSVIGPNGAGKTTLFHLISGLLVPTMGSRAFQGKPYDGLKPHEIAALGISRTFQNLALFDNLTVLQNVMVGRHIRSHGEFWRSGLGFKGAKEVEKRIRSAASDSLEVLGLGKKVDEMAGNLPYGEQKLLEIARALATEPKLVLLDEPASGLNEKETENVATLILKMREMGITVLLVEHDMSLVMDISEEILVLNYGMKIAEGPPKAIQENPAVIEAYLGGEFNV